MLLNTVSTLSVLAIILGTYIVSAPVVFADSEYNEYNFSERDEHRGQYSERYDYEGDYYNGRENDYNTSQYDYNDSFREVGNTYSPVLQNQESASFNSGNINTSQNDAVLKAQIRSLQEMLTSLLKQLAASLGASV